MVYNDGPQVLLFRTSLGTRGFSIPNVRLMDATLGALYAAGDNQSPGRAPSDIRCGFEMQMLSVPGS